MEVMVVLIGFSLLVALGFLAAFFWAVRSGQFDDSVTPSYRILFEERTPSDGSRGSDRVQRNRPNPTSSTNPNQNEPDR